MDRYHELLEKDGHAPFDGEHKALFWILSQNPDLYKRKDLIYDFDEHSIIPGCLEEDQFSSSEKAMIRLGFNLYDGLMTHNNDVSDIFSVLDARNFEICIHAIRIRFDKVGG